MPLKGPRLQNAEGPNPATDSTPGSGSDWNEAQARLELLTLFTLHILFLEFTIHHIP